MSPIRLSRFESAVRVVLAYQEAFNRHDLASMMQHLSDDCLLESCGPIPDGAVCEGKEAVAHFWQAFFRDLSQAHSEIEEIFGLGERCVMRWRCHRGGESDHLRGVDIFRVRDGLIRGQLSYVKGGWRRGEE